MKPGQTWRRYARLAGATLAMMIAAVTHADATNGRNERPIESIDSRPAGDPIMAIVSLRSQRITVYDANGWIIRAPVSSGQKGRETPAGIFSVIQKDADHHSNLYDDASMPNMQRLTWSGIALHGGPLPGYPASHGCVRLPYDFAERLFEMTQMGIRVIVAPTDTAPVEIAHPALLPSKPGAGAMAAARAAEADEASRKVDQARTASIIAFRESAQARIPVRVAENLKARTETQLAAAEAALAAATSPEAKEAAEHDKADATARIAELQTQADTAKAALQTKLDAVTAAREITATAEATRVAAVEAARQVARELQPVSVLISRKTQRIYVRQAFEPVLEAPVTISDPDRPVGTHIFTAIEQISGDSKMRWNVVSLEGSRTQGGASDTRNAKTDSAKDALDRITIPQDILDRIPGMSPRSSMIVTDEAPSAETSKGTDFIIVLSDEPQGGIKIRRPGTNPDAVVGLARSRERLLRSPFAAGYSTW